MASPAGGFKEAVRDLVGAFLPLSARTLGREIEERLHEVPNELNEFGFDPYGLSLDAARRMMIPMALLYRSYFRVETHGIERVSKGRVLLIANHAGQLPFDGAMLATAMLLEAKPPRICRAMGEYFIPRLPWMSIAMARAGALVGTPENCIHMLENDECVAVFPEGARGMNKPYSERYQLQTMGKGFMRLALETGTPIVPVAIVGSDDQQPGIANLRGLGRALGLPALPITVGFPLLGPLGLLPMPVKYRIYFGDPMHFEGDASDEESALHEKVGVVRNAIETMLDKGVRERPGIFT
ncbi:MAG: lysophospholipid acyltransferase family protein [Myxococcota bacterium]